MRDVASLYGDPLPSLVSGSRDTMSREPEGLDPRDDFYSSQLEPDGFRADEQPEPIPEQIEPDEKVPLESPKIEHRDDAFGSFSKNKDFSSQESPIDLAKLVGVPPPPPNTPPPKKGKRGVDKLSTPNTIQAVKVVSSIKENDVETSSFDKEDAVENNNIRVVVPPSPAESSATNDSRSKSSASRRSSGPLTDRSSTGLPTSTLATMKKAREIIQARRQLALSTYEREDLVLDGTHTMSENKKDGIGDISSGQLSLFPKDPMTWSPRETPLSPTLRTGHTRSALSPREILDSPSSATTKTHSNQTQSQSNELQVSEVDEKPSACAVCEIDVSKAKRPTLLERRNHSQTDNPAECGEKKQKKKGFLGKLFKKRRGRNRASVSATFGDTHPVNHESDPTLQLLTDENCFNEVRLPSISEAPISHTVSNSQERGFGKKDNVALDETSTIQTTGLPRRYSSLKPALKSVENRQYQQDTINTFAEIGTIRNMSSLTNGTMNKKNHEVLELKMRDEIQVSVSYGTEGSNFDLNQACSQDPPSDECGDPPAYPRLPLLSPTKNTLPVDVKLDENDQSRTKSVLLKIPDSNEDHLHSHREGLDRMVDGLPTNISNERSNALGSHDEVSILSGPSFESLHKKRSFDPSPKNLDGSTFGKDDWPPALRLEIQEHFMEPTGASPVVLDSTRVDEGTRRPVFGDPVGNSPAHCEEVRAPSNDPLGMSPSHVSKAGKIPCERVIGSLHDENRIEITQTGSDVGDPPILDSCLSDDSVVEIAADDTHVNPYSKQSNGLAALVDIEFIDPSDNQREANEIAMVSPSKTFVSRTELNFVSTSSIYQAINDATTGNTSLVVVESEKPSTSHTSKTNGSLAESMILTTGDTSKQSTKDLEIPHVRSKRDPLKVLPCIKADPCSMEKASIKSSPSSVKKPLTISAAAFTNAKAVAYIHQLHGDPSPRHLWHKSKARKGENATTGTPKQPNLKKNLKNLNSKKKSVYSRSLRKAPSPDEYCATNMDLDDLIFEENHSTATGEPSPINTPSKDSLKKYLKNGLGSRFQGRRPTKKAGSTSDSQTCQLKSRSSPGQKKTQHESLALIVPLGKITGMAVSRGVKLRRIKHQDAILRDLSEPVAMKPKQKPSGGNRFKMIRSSVEEIKDPIKRAGRRLLSKAAVPIQAAGRRYLAKQVALDRMWTIIQVQSYFRRWRCETYLQARIHSATLIQKAARGLLAREHIQEKHASAITIQKIIRGYIAAIRAYDAIYYVTRLQGLVRRYLFRLEVLRRKEAASVLQAFYAKLQHRKKEAAVDIQRIYRGYKVYKVLKGFPHVVGLQTLFRGYKARKKYTYIKSATIIIQSHWRSFAACTEFQMQIADIITVQSLVRQWLVLREAELVRFSAHSDAVIRVQYVWRSYLMRTLFRKQKAAIQIQCHWRCHTSKTRLKREQAALKIQSTWRGFHAYTDYIFLIVDVLVVQRKVRQWLAIKKIDCLRKHKAATVFQSLWRRHQAQKGLLFALVHIILVQSIARRFLSMSCVAARRVEVTKYRAECRKKEKAATDIQRAWRGFWGYSHFVIVRYETTRVQALIRGHLAKSRCKQRLRCVIRFQAVGRRFLAIKDLVDKGIKNALISAQALQLREKNAANRLQFWWRIVLDWTTEKKAALTIERFFIFVKAEVDREIRKRETKRLAKEKKSKERRRQSDEQLLDKAWLNSVDGSQRTRSISSEGTQMKKRSSRLPSSDQDIQENQGVNPKQHLGAQVQEPPNSVQLAPSHDFSFVSNITNPSVFHKVSSNKTKKIHTEITEELGFEFSHSFHKGGPSSAKNEKKHRLSTEDYIRKYSMGLKTAPNRVSKSDSSEHFFSKQGENQQHSCGTPTTYTQSRSQASTPRSYADSGISSKRRSTANPAISISIGTPRGAVEGSPRVPSTPRSTSNSCSGSSPRGFSSNGRQESFSPRFLPPITPTSRRKGANVSHPILRPSTSETESQATMSDTIYHSRSSPRRPYSHGTGIHGRGGKNPVMIMKTYSGSEDGQSSIHEAHEIMLLGEEYGEV